MNQDDERLIAANEAVEEAAEELDHTLIKALDNRDIVVDNLDVDVNESFNEIKGKATCGGKEVTILATLDEPSHNWNVNINDVLVVIDSEDIDFELTELEEAQDKVTALEEGADEEEMDHPDGEDEAYPD